MVSGFLSQSSRPVLAAATASAQPIIFARDLLERCFREVETSLGQVCRVCDFSYSRDRRIVEFGAAMAAKTATGTSARIPQF